VFTKDKQFICLTRRPLFLIYFKCIYVLTVLFNLSDQLLWSIFSFLCSYLLTIVCLLIFIFCGHYIVCSLTYGFWLPICYIQTFLNKLAFKNKERLWIYQGLWTNNDVCHLLYGKRTSTWRRVWIAPTAVHKLAVFRITYFLQRICIAVTVKHVQHDTRNK
jgi:hypothetical protein